MAFLEGDAEEIGFPDNAFDVVLSTFGSMFAPNHEKAADELIRVCRPGGKIRMANWTPTGFGGAFFWCRKATGSPSTRAETSEPLGYGRSFAAAFGDRVTFEVKPQHFVFRYRPPAHWIEVFSTTFGPVMKALEALDDPGRERLRLELHRVIGEFNKVTDGTWLSPPNTSRWWRRNRDRAFPSAER